MYPAQEATPDKTRLHWSGILPSHLIHRWTPLLFVNISSQVSTVKIREVFHTEKSQGYHPLYTYPTFPNGRLLLPLSQSSSASD